jgi:hypothetical protein
MRRLFFVLIALIATNSSATDVADVYQSQMRVSSQAEQEKQLLTPELLRQVILKVVGDRATLDVVDLNPVLSRSADFIDQYHYLKIEPKQKDLTQPDQLALSLSFNKPALNKALVDLALPIWSESRPDTILWLAIDDSGNKTLLGAESDSVLITDVLDSAQQRGLPALLPVMDLQDQQQVRFADVWAGFSENVELASQRYGAAIAVMAKVSIENGQALIQWQTRLNNRIESWQSRGDTSAAIKAGIEELTDRISRQYTQVITSNFARNYQLQVAGITSYTDFERVMTYLEKRQYVSGIELTSLAGDTMGLTISLKGDITAFKQALAIDRVLTEDRFEQSGANVLRYNLL